MFDSVEQSIVQVLAKGDGLGVVSNGYIFTAAHCIDFDIEGGIALGDFRYQECKTCDGEEFLADNLFVDAVSDLAVLCCPDEQAAWKEAKIYDKVTEGQGIELYRGEVPSWDDEPMTVRIRNKNGWVDGEVHNSGSGRVWVRASEQIHGGASGGPVISCNSNELVAINSWYNESGGECEGLQPVIRRALPVWLAKELCVEF